MQEYQNAINVEILNFVNSIHKGEKTGKFVFVTNLSSGAAQAIEILTGKDVNSFSVVLDKSAVRHIEKRHGKNGKQDHSMSNPEDIARMGFIIDHYDSIAYDGFVSTGYLDEDGNPAPMIKIVKDVGMEYYVICAISSAKNRRLYIVTAYRHKKEQSPDP